MKAIQEHIDLLEEKVFQIETKWPQFKLLINDLKKLSTGLKPGSQVVCFERTLLYGGFSLIAPIFKKEGINFQSIDCSPSSADERGAYNSSMVEDRRFIKVKFTKRAAMENTGLQEACADLVLVPNLVHHVKKQDKLFAELNRIAKPKGQLYIFEPLVRELHQEPDDFLRYTPYGLKYSLEQSGFGAITHNTTGGPFETISYCWLQALEYLPDNERQKYEKWFHEKHFKELLQLDRDFSKNLSRNYTSFPTAYSLMATKN